MLFSTSVSYLPGLDARGNGRPGVVRCYFGLSSHIYLDVDACRNGGLGVVRCYFGHMYLDVDAHGNGLAFHMSLDARLISLII